MQYIHLYIGMYVIYKSTDEKIIWDIKIMITSFFFVILLVDNHQD